MAWRLGVRQAFVVDASQAVDDADVAGLRQERRVVDEAPEREQAVDAAGVSVVAKDAADAHHDTTSTSNAIVLARVVSRRAFDEASRIRSISGSRRVAHSANPYRPPEHQQAGEERVEQVERGGAEEQREEEQRRSTPQIVSGRWSAL